MNPLDQDSDKTLSASQHRTLRPLRSDQLWIGIAGLLFTLGMAARFGVNWILVPLACILACAAVYALVPTGRRERRLAREIDRQTLLEKWSEVVGKLSKSSHQRYDRLHNRVSRLGDLQRRGHKRSLLQPGEYLLWLFLKLLIARDFLEEEAVTSSVASLQEQRRLIETELLDPSLSKTARHSKEETLLILDQRVDAARSRVSRIQEIESDLTRIEHKLALMHDRAAQHNTLGDSGRRIDFSDEIQTGATLSSLHSSPLDELDSLVTAQVYA